MPRNYKKASRFNKTQKRVMLISKQRKNTSIMERLIYPPWAKKPFSVLTGIISKEPLMIDKAN